MRNHSNEMETDNFHEMLEESSQIDEEIEDSNEQIVSISKLTLLNSEKLQVQEEITQLWNYLAESKSRQTMLEEELEKKSEISNSLISINEQNNENLKKIRMHQNTLVDFISNLETNRNEVAEDFEILKKEYEETFLELSERLKYIRKDENDHDTEILKLREEIRQRDERLVLAMETHCKDQKLINEISEKLKNSSNNDKCTRDEFEKLRFDCQQKEAMLKQEKDHLMLNIETMREKFTTDLFNAKQTMDSLSKLRHQELQQFKTQLKLQLEKNSKLEDRIKTLENKLAAEKENVQPVVNKTPTSVRNKRSSTSSPYSDADTSYNSIHPNQEPIFKKRKFDYFGSDSDQPIIKEEFFRRVPPSVPVDSTSGPFDKDELRSYKTA